LAMEREWPACDAKPMVHVLELVVCCDLQA
jgi:hypothetical protein